MSAKTLMIQGTGSGVGKSVITAAFCRWFHLQGWRVAPFKAQNMSLNSYVTADGGEMGRAQVYQAEACGIPPHVAMNPVLLKPCGDNLSQVIVMGKVVATRNAKDYYADKPRFIKEVASAFEYLKTKYEMVILEGAGSPAEINLREQDFVNMAMADMADAPVLIVGDIDRGGVFAWMKGTYDLLTPPEQDRVKDFLLINFVAIWIFCVRGSNSLKPWFKNRFWASFPSTANFMWMRKMPFLHGTVANALPAKACWTLPSFACHAFPISRILRRWCWNPAVPSAMSGTPIKWEIQT